MSKSNNKALIPKLRFPEFKNAGDWDKKELSEISDHITEKVDTRKLTTVSISAGYGYVSQAEKFSRDISGQQYKNYIFLKKGDFAYNKGNSKLFPQGCIYKLKEFEEAAAPNAFICFRFKTIVVPDFYQGYFENNFHGKQLKKYITSGARMDGLLNIRSIDFFSIILPTPRKKNEQQKIAHCLSSLDEVIKAESQKLDVLKEHKKGLLQNLLPQEGETMPKLRLKEYEESGDWKETTLTQVADYENGKAHEQDIEDSGDIVVVNSKFISSDGEVKKYTNTAYCPAQKGDILMVLSDVPNGKAIAKCFLVEVDHRYTVNQRICKITSYNLNSKILFYLLNRNPYFLAFDDGVKQTNLRKEDVLNCPLLIPTDPKEQEKIAEIFSSIDYLINGQKQKVEALKFHKKGLLQSLFPDVNGENE